MKYTLKQLLYEKYGEERFSIACEITARWVQFETKNKHFNVEWIQQLCNACDISEVEIYSPAAEALRKLFGLKTIDELYI
jgi:hypothetical protein